MEVRAVPGNQSLSDFPVIQGIYREIGALFVDLGRKGPRKPAVFVGFRCKFPTKITGKSTSQI